MIPLVLLPQSPVPTTIYPTISSPTLDNAPTVSVPSNAAEITPACTILLVEVIFAPQIPTRPLFDPASLFIAVKRSHSVFVQTNSLERTSLPTLPPMEFVIKSILTGQVPITASSMPLGTSPTLESAEAVQMAAHAARLSKEPPRLSVKMVSLPEFPVRTDTLPTPLIIAVFNAVPIQVKTDSLVTSNLPLDSSMEFMVETIFLDQLPIPSDGYPPSACPSIVNATTIKVTSKSTILAGPYPAVWFVVVVFLPHSPI